MPTGIYKRVKKWKLSKDTKLKMSEMRRGKHLTKEAKEKLRTFRTGKKLSEETKRKIVKTRRKNGSYNWSNESRKKLSLAMKGRKGFWLGKKLTAEHVKRIFETRKNNSKGQWHSKETKIKIGLAMKGRTFTEEMKRRMSKASKKSINSGRFKNGHLGIVGEKHYLWKKNFVGYIALHAWVSRWKGKISKCEICGTKNAKKFEWANIDHTYKRNLDDYMRMCTSCHRNYDNMFLK